MPNQFNTNPYIGSWMANLSTPAQPTTINQPQSSLVWVNGLDGATNYPVARGNTILLLDSQDSKFYLKSMDLTGAVSIRKFKFEELTEDVKPEIKEEPKEEVNLFNKMEASLNGLCNRLDDRDSYLDKILNEQSDYLKSLEDKLNRIENKQVERWSNKSHKRNNVHTPEGE